jgi:hypothetical protein
MGVIFGMTAIALLRQSLPALPDVTRQAGRSSVFARQRKSCFGMIKRQRLFPIKHRVA